jgi:hypothetical protein
MYESLNNMSERARKRASEFLCNKESVKFGNENVPDKTGAIFNCSLILLIFVELL